MSIKFTDDELSLLKGCFDIESGDHYARHTLLPQWLQEDCNLTEEETEKLFKSIECKFVKWISINLQNEKQVGD